jgi:hypothetical protein
MLSRSRFLLSLVAALLLSTLASANSAPVNVNFPHSGASVYDGAYAYPTHPSIGSVTATLTMFGTVNHHASTGEAGNSNGIGLILGQPAFAKGIADYNSTRIAFQDGTHGINCYRARRPAGWNQGAPAATTPEPGSLMLLSTGLLGIAGVVRRKLLLG